MPVQVTRFRDGLYGAGRCMRRLLAVLLPVMVAVSCTPSPNAQAPGERAGALTVFVNIAPQGDLVRRIGGDAVDVHVLLPPGADPHSFTPSPRQIMRLGEADIYFHGIMPFGRRIAERVAELDAAVRVVDLTEGIAFRPMEEHDHHSCDGGHDHHAHHAGHPDPHVWLGPPELAVQVRRAAEALQRVDPERSAAYAANRDALLAELDALHAQLQETLAPLHGRSFYVFHPAFGYFARAYGLRQRAVETGGKSPTPGRLRALVAQAREEGVQVIFVQPQFDRSSAESVARAIGGVVLPLDPLAEDVLDNLRRIGDRIRAALDDGS